MSECSNSGCAFANSHISLDGSESGPSSARGLAVLETDGGTFEADGLKLIHHRCGKNRAALTWSAADGAIHWQSKWTLCPETGIWSRKDTLRNIGSETVTIFRCLARFTFSPARYEIYSQRSDWCNENQGLWQDLDHGAFVLGCHGGRTTQDGTPYLCLRERGSDHGLSFHLLPRGNWVIKVRTRAAGAGRDSLPFVVVELGLADESLRLELPPQSDFELPEILIQSLPQGRPELGAPILHRYVRDKPLSAGRKIAPVVYNTWFDAFEELDVHRLRKQLAAAQKLGCEVFTVDAGWYGAGNGNWGQQVGDWREKPDAAFRGGMAEFAAEVRAAGLGFGLWIEPERNAATVPAVRAHPDWFLRGANGFFYPDLTRSEVYDYILAEMSRLVESYELVWLKVDFNFELGHDPAALARYYERWYALLDKLRAAYPRLFLEGCASGGLRSDLNTLAHFNGHFLSDTVNPIDALRIYQGALLRLPPGRLGRWIVLRAVGKTIPHYGRPLAQTPETLVTPGGATWAESVTVGVDFAARAALPGMLGLSGDIAGLPEETRQRLRHHIAFYKEWRAFIVGSVAHLLTPARRKEERGGWAAIQLQKPGETTSLLFVYRLDDGAPKKWFPLCGLQAEQIYEVVNDDLADEPARSFSGRELMDSGLPVELAERNSAAVFVVTRKVYSL